MRSYQDLFDRREVFEALVLKELNQTAKKRNGGTIKNLRMQLEKIQSTLNEVRDRLQQDFPDYSNLARPKPLSIKDVQHLLLPEEVLLTYVVGKVESYLWVIRPDLEKFFTLPAGEDELTQTITQLRKSLNPESTLRSFDLEKAQHLYDLLIKPAELYVKGSDHLLIVPNGPLESLPMGLLVKQQDRKFQFKNHKSRLKIREVTAILGVRGTKPEIDQSTEEGSTKKQYLSYSEAKWLAKEYAITMLPSVSSLKALRGGGTNVSSKAPKSFMGFGDPLLGNVIVDNKYIPSSAELLSRGAVADA